MVKLAMKVKEINWLYSNIKVSCLLCGLKRGRGDLPSNGDLVRVWTVFSSEGVLISESQCV